MPIYNIGGGGSSPYFGDPVATAAALPVIGNDGEMRLAIDTGVIYFWDGSAWSTSSATDSTKVAKAGDTMSGELKADGGIDVTATGGSDVLNIGTGNADVINIGRSGATVNIQGTTHYQNVTNLNVADKNITLNKGGSVASATSSGIELEENSVITGYAQTSSDRNSWELKAPNTSGIATVTPGSGGITLDQSSHNPVTIGTANGLSLSTQQLSLAASSGSTTGALSSADWTTFNNKEPAISAGTTDQYYRGDKSFQTLQVSALVPVTDGSSASSGKIGEILTASQASNTATGVGSTGVYGNVTSVSLTAGVWSVYGTVGFNENGAVLTDSLVCGISDSATGVGLNEFDTAQHSYLVSGSDPVFGTPTVTVSIPSTTTYYLNTKFNYSSGGPRHRGRITAIRVR